MVGLALWLSISVVFANPNFAPATISPMALYRLVCALGQHNLVTVLTRCGLPLPVYFLADEKHSHCLTEHVYLPTIVCGRVIWHLGYTEDASAAALTRLSAPPSASRVIFCVCLEVL
jgi:hypothetical protein